MNSNSKVRIQRSNSITIILQIQKENKKTMETDKSNLKAITEASN